MTITASAAADEGAGGGNGAGRNPARAMLVRAFVAQNCAIGSIYGGFGISILHLQDRFHSSRGATSLGLSLVILATALSGLALASLSRRFGLRSIMVAGGVLCILGYAAIALAPNLGVALLAFALLVGPGVGLSGTLPASTLVSGWFPGAQGKAIGLATMPVLMVVMPIAGTAIIERWGVGTFYFALAALHLVSLPVLAGIREAPRDDAGAGRGAGADGGESRFPPGEANHVLTVRGLLARPLFWASMIGGGLMNAIAITGSLHLYTVMIEQGLPAMEAALLTSLMSVAAVAGAVLIGWLCDRMGGSRVLVLMALAYALAWAVLGTTGKMAAMLPAIVVIGLAGPGVFPALSLLKTRAYGLATMPRAMALFGMFSVPFTFVLPALAGWAHDAAGGYAPMMVAIIATAIVVAVLFCAIAATERRWVRPGSGFAA